MKLKMLFSVVAMSSLVMTTGCSNKTKAERDSLLKQNQDLNAQLQQEKAAHTDAENRANAAANATPVAAAPGTPEMTAPPTDMTPPDNTGGTEMGTGVKIGKNAAGETQIDIASDVLFDSGKAALKPTAKKTLDRVAVQLKKYNGNLLRVEGHTDPNPVKHSGWDDNWDLGAARARAVALYLIERGIPKKSIYIASFADNDLKSTKNLALDRRVDIVVVKTNR